MSEITKINETLPKEIIKRSIHNLNLTVNDVIFTVCCYLMSSCNMPGGASPFAMGAFIAAFSNSKWLLFAFSSALGIIRFQTGIEAFTYFLAFVAVVPVMAVVRADFTKRALFASGVFAFVRIIGNVIGGGEWYDNAFAITESIACFLSAGVFKNAVPLFTDAIKRKCIPDTEVFCLLLFLALALRCTVGYPLVMGLNISMVLAMVILFVINTEGSPAIGCAIGVLFGFSVYDSSMDVASTVGVFAVCSMSSALFNRLGRWGVVLGFMLANVVFLTFFRDVVLVFDVLEIIVASIVFALFPRPVKAYAEMINSKTVRLATKAFIEQDKLQNIITKRLVSLSDSFSALASSYEECFKNDTISKNYIVHMFDTAAGKICPDCGLKYNCWERSYKDTYKAMFELLEKYEEKGRIKKEDIPKYLSSKCIKLEEFITHFERMLDIYRVEKMWHQKLNDSRKLVADQLRGISRSVANTAYEFDMCVDTAAERVLKGKLDKEKVNFKNVVFLKGRNDDLSVEICMERWTYARKDEAQLETIIETVTGKKVTLTSAVNTGDGVSLTFRDSFRYRASIGSAALPKDGEKVSGDSYVVCRSRGDCAVAAISDGMGTGAEAAMQSKTAIDLLDNFLGSGIDTETALELINSSLLLRTSGESFSTMDVCRVDLSVGSILISKNGAATGYIKTGEEILAIESDSLPFGVLPHYGKISTKLFPVKDKSCVVMMSDGVADVFSLNDEKYVSRILAQTDCDNPQLMASAILQKALDLSGGKAMDDMTVVVVNVWEK